MQPPNVAWFSHAAKAQAIEGDSYGANSNPGHGVYDIPMASGPGLTVVGQRNGQCNLRATGNAGAGSYTSNMAVQAPRNSYAKPRTISSSSAMANSSSTISTVLDADFWPMR